MQGTVKVNKISLIYKYKTLKHETSTLASNTEYRKKTSAREYW